MENLKSKINLETPKLEGFLASSLNTEKYKSDNSKNNIDVVFQPTGSFFSLLMDTKTKKTENDYGLFDISSENTQLLALSSDDDDEDKTKKDVFKFMKDPVNSFFIGSITVVGLYVLFKLLNKNK
jgi:hypothetical protein